MRKTHSGAKKRLIVTQSGIIKMKPVRLQHNLRKRTQDAKRQRFNHVIFSGDARHLRRQQILPYS
jgi:ribosomal protein L35